jgi:hypothetical protein
MHQTKLAIVLPVALLASAAAARPDLYSNGPYVTHSGAGAGGAGLSMLQTSLSCQTFGFTCQAFTGWRLADDFTVPAGGWVISSVVLYSFQSGAGTGTPTISSVNLRIWSGRPGDAGSTVVFGNTTENRLVSATWTGVYRAPETDMLDVNRPVYAVEAAINPPLTLAPGVYWLDWQASGSLASGPYVVPVTILGQTSAPNGNGRVYVGPSGPWQNARDTGTTAQQEMAFLVRGTSGATAPSCYPNCDSSTAPPCLNVLDFGCFLNKFAAGDTVANCDSSTAAPVLNVLDFGCFLNRFAAGCSSC